MSETNRERLKRLGITYEKAFADLDNEELCRYCPHEGFREHNGALSSPNGPIMCEGAFCDCAFEDWLDDEADEVDSDG